MNFKQSFLLAVKSLKASKMRSFLTMLGIIIGVAAVIVLVSLIGGFSKSMTDTFESMGTNLISVNIMGRGGNRSISPTDFQDFSDENSDVIAYGTPTVNVSSVTVKRDNSNTTTTVYGTNEFYDDIKNYVVSSGRFLQYVDVERKQYVCVIGTYIASELFPGESPIGQDLKLNGKTYTVVGLLEEKADSTEDSDDDLIIAPYTVVIKLSGNARVSSYSFSATSSDTSEEAMTRIEALLLETFSSTSAYRVMNQAEMLETVNELSGTLTLVLVGVAGISLLVGGIGIMNIMLVSVTERTKEIGIRKSLGAKRRDIMRQFIIEAGTTSAAGGVVGIVFGIIVSLVVGKLVGLSATPSVLSVAIAFSVSVGIGIIFGYFPAGKASKLNPIDALRYD